MTTTLQISDKRGDAILLVKVEAPSDAPIEAVESAFAAAAGLAGLGTAYESFGLAPAATIPAITQLTRPAQEPWGNPPVQPMVPAAVQQQQPATAAGPVCQHGPKTLISSKPGAPKPWQFWGCNARQDDPTKCEKEWVR